MCVNDMYECQKVSTLYTVILPLHYAPVTLPLTPYDASAWPETAPISSSRGSTSGPITISTDIHRAFPEIGSYGKAGLAC
ncbi:hypothetical protein Q1695_004700 [Nippostrongylus brasiliensis]|nr:hypothetical protein Q1695_004700 [Nippostrongylus brasiliensis]